LLEKAATVSQPEIRFVFSMSARIGVRGGGGQTGGEGPRGPRKAGQVEEQFLHDGGDGGVVLCRPDARLAVRIVADGYGDVAHGASLDLAAFLNCAPGEGNYMQNP
jgi:hypothetical protein